jgi:hypothetical protein
MLQINQYTLETAAAALVQLVLTHQNMTLYSLMLLLLFVRAFKRNSDVLVLDFESRKHELKAMQARLDEMRERHSSLTRDAARLQSAAKHALRAQTEALNSTSNTAHAIAG